MTVLDSSAPNLDEMLSDAEIDRLVKVALKKLPDDEDWPPDSACRRPSSGVLCVLMFLLGMTAMEGLRLVLGPDVGAEGAASAMWRCGGTTESLQWEENPGGDVAVGPLPSPSPLPVRTGPREGRPHP